MTATVLFQQPVAIRTRSRTQCDVAKGSRCSAARGLRRALVHKASINQTSDPGRSDEIAAKIAAHRREKRLKPQSPAQGSELQQPDSSPSTQSVNDAEKSREEQVRNKDLEATPPMVTKDVQTGAPQIRFSDLPDWKKEEIFLSQMREAENFMNRTSTEGRKEASDEGRGSVKESGGGEENRGEGDEKNTYKPRVSTWGVFPRPDNISRTFGGGRRIEPGGADFESKEWKERDMRVAEKLASYRASRGIDVALEEEHASEIEDALRLSDEYLRGTEVSKAIDVLESVRVYVSESSRRGGDVLLNLALAYESFGQREAAKELYISLKKSPFVDISSKARQLLQGFADMQTLRVNDGENDSGAGQGLRVMQFRLPDVAALATDRRYETAISGGLSQGSERGSSKVSNSVNMAVAGIIMAPLALVVALILVRNL